MIDGITELKMMLDHNVNNSTEIRRIDAQIDSLKKEKDMLNSHTSAVFAKTYKSIQWTLDSVGTILSIPANHVVQLVGYGMDVSGQPYFLVNPKIDGCETYLTISSEYIEPYNADEDTENVLETTIE